MTKLQLKLAITISLGIAVVSCAKQGDVGPAGAKGPTGDTGPAGVAKQGAQGPTGQQGDKGVTGPQGNLGKPGTLRAFNIGWKELSNWSLTSDATSGINRTVSFEQEIADTRITTQSITDGYHDVYLREPSSSPFTCVKGVYTFFKETVKGSGDYFYLTYEIKEGKLIAKAKVEYADTTSEAMLKALNETKLQLYFSMAY